MGFLSGILKVGFVEKYDLICILQLNIDGNGLRGGANAPHNDSMYQVNHYICKGEGAPKSRDGRDNIQNSFLITVFIELLLWIDKNAI